MPEFDVGPAHICNPRATTTASVTSGPGDWLSAYGCNKEWRRVSEQDCSHPEMAGTSVHGLLPVHVLHCCCGRTARNATTL